MSLASLSPNPSLPDSDRPKRISLPGRLQLMGDPPYPAFGSASVAGANPRLLSRSHHNLGQVPESPESRAGPPASSQSQSSARRAQLLASHQRASSDTDSITAARRPERCVSQGYDLRPLLSSTFPPLLFTNSGCPYGSSRPSLSLFKWLRFPSCSMH